LRFDSYAEKRAFISALESEGYFAQASITGMMFRRDSMRIPASAFATIYKPKQDDREIRQNAQIHAKGGKGTAMFEKFWELYEAVSDFDSPDGWVQGFQFGAEMNAAVLEIMAYENSLNSIDEDEEDRALNEMRERVRWADLEDEDEEEFLSASTLSRLRKQRG